MPNKYFKEIFLANLLVKKCVGKGEFIFEVLGPMLGTIDFQKGIFINNHDKKYLEMTDSKFILADKRYCFYNYVSLEEFSKENANLENIEELVKRYKEKYEKRIYYMCFHKSDDYFVIALEKDKLKMISKEENIAKKINGDDFL